MKHLVILVLAAALGGCDSVSDREQEQAPAAGAGADAAADADARRGDPAAAAPGTTPGGAPPDAGAMPGGAMPGGAMPGGAMPPMPTDAAGYMAMAGAGDLYEVQSSKLAQERSQNADVKEFARMMVEHHTKTSTDLAAAAKEAGLAPPPPALDAKKSQMMQELQAAVTDFDRVYLQQQAMAHEEARALHSTYAERGDNPQLKAAAASTVPIIDQHRSELQRLNAGNTAAR